MRCRDRRGRGAGAGAREARRLARGARARRRGAGLRSSRGSRTCSGSPSATAPRPARISSPPGGSSSSASPSDDPAVLVFEDLQWADAGLLDFVEYLLEWSRSHPIFVLALARPELAERRPASGVGRPQLHRARPRAARRTGDGGAARRARARACRTELRGRSSPARRVSRSTRSRRCGCCSTGACSRRRATSTGRRGRSRRSRCPRRCTR